MFANNDTLTDCSPLTPACIKALTDRIEEKRKLAAGEIEKMTVEFSMSDNLTMINRLVIVLRKFCLSLSPNTRKGGLIGLAAVMVGFKNGSIAEPPPEVVEEVVRPILTCFLDSDSRVRYYACESLYNVTKVAKSNTLHLFAEIFDNMAKIVADADTSVRGGGELLDKLLQDIVVEQQSFDETFVPRLKEYIYAKNPFTRMFIISWIRLLERKIDMIKHLPNLLDGIFNCLCDSTQEIRASTLNLLSEFLNKIVVCPTGKVDIPSLTTILLKYARNDREDVVQYTATAWLRQFITLMDDQDLINFTPGILVAILPSLALQTIPDVSVTSNRNTNPNLQRHFTQSPSRDNICEISSLVNSSLLERVTIVLRDKRNTLSCEPTHNDLEPILEVLVRELQKQDHPIIKLAILEWFKRLKKAEPEIVFTNTIQQKLFQILLETLSARSDAVVKNALRVIADTFCFECGDEQQMANTAAQLEENLITIKEDESTADLDKRRDPPAKSPVRTKPILQKGPNDGVKKVAISTSDTSATRQSNANIGRFIQALCKTFRDNDSVFDERGTFIVLNLCSMVKPDIIYKSFADIIRDDKMDLKFAYNLIEKLNRILLTTQPLFGLRARLGNDDDPEMAALFHSLYYAWCNSPIAVLTLCLLTHNYRLASEIVMALAQADVNVDILTQIDWVVQLIESPVFASLRMRLLDVNSNQYLLQSLYGLLMILPQSDAYTKLGHRLDQVYKFMSSQLLFKAAPTPGIQSSSSTHKLSLPSKDKDLKKTSSVPNLDSLMRHYFNVQSQRTKQIRTSESNDDDY